MAANPWNPYRESLVLESETIWPDDLNLVNPTERKRIEEKLHADPAQAENLEYVRLYTGFSRRITVTAADIARLGGMPFTGAAGVGMSYGDLHAGPLTMLGIVPDEGMSPLDT